MSEGVNNLTSAAAPSGAETEDKTIVTVTYFTDPLCCYSWAMEPQWRRLQYEYAQSLQVRYVMGGLLPDWTSFNDGINNINRPAQMGPLWMQASHISGMPMKSTLWHTDPPVSSYPACIAVKCAQAQSVTAGARYLRLLRENLMIDGKNIAKEEVLIDIAAQLTVETGGGFDLQRFKEDLINGNGMALFRSDMHAVQIQNIQRFPALIFRRLGYPAVLVTGYKPYAVLVQAFGQAGGEVHKTNTATRSSFVNYWHSATERELEEINEQ